MSVILEKRSYAMVVPGVYIGSARAVYNTDFLTKHKIGLIINASNRNNNETPLDIPTVLIYKIRDKIPSSNINEFAADLYRKADDVSHIIKHFRDNNIPVLIHCQAGINRSAFVLCTYLIKHKDWNPEAIIILLRDINSTKRGRPALTNKLFERMLLDTKKII